MQELCGGQASLPRWSPTLNRESRATPLPCTSTWYRILCMKSIEHYFRIQGVPKRSFFVRERELFFSAPPATPAPPLLLFKLRVVYTITNTQLFVLFALLSCTEWSATAAATYLVYTTINVLIYTYDGATTHDALFGGRWIRGLLRSLTADGRCLMVAGC